MHLFETTARPRPDLLYRRDDPNDMRLGEVVLTEPGDYTRADVVLLGLPQDEGVARNKGRTGARDAPDAVRRWLYRMMAVDRLTLFDLGNTTPEDTLEATHEVHHANVARLLQDGKQVVVLGGGNDTSYPDCKALSSVTSGNLLAFNVDAHFDVRADSPRNSGTPYRQLLEEGHVQPSRLYEIGYQPFANSQTYIDYLRDTGVTAYPLESVQFEGIVALLSRLLHTHKDAEAIFWGLDMDVVRAADAPGVSAVNPTGLSGDAFTRVGTVAGGDARTRLFEITEVNPTYDIDERTCRLAAAAIWHFLAATIAQ